MSFTITARTKTQVAAAANSTPAPQTTSVTNGATSSKFTPEQLKRMEENRQRALLLKQKNKSADSILATSNTITELVKNNNPLHVIPENTTSSSAGTLSKPAGNSVVSPVKQQQASGAISANYGKCVYLDLDESGDARFEVHVGFNKALIDLFKTISSRKYEPTTKRWSFSMKNYDEVLLKCKNLPSPVRLEPLDRVPLSSTKLAKFILIDRQSFEVQVPFNAELQEIFKTMETRKYDPVTKKWSFSFKDYQSLINKINAKFKKGEVTIQPLPRAVREVFKSQFEGSTVKPRFDPKIDFEFVKAKIDPAIAKSLLPFQIEGICFAIQQNGRMLIADDMGLGKTIQGLALASYYKEEWPVFIIVPSSVKFMWKESVKKWLAHSLNQVCKTDCLDDCVQVLENGRQPIDSDCKVVISSYDLLAKNVDEIMTQGEYKMIIADECHLLKNSKASRTKAALKLIQNANRVILLSGTPALSRPAELYSQIQALQPNLFTSFHEFGSRYCDAKESKFGWDYSGYSNMTELRTLLEERLLIRREKKDVIQQLPSKMREMVILDPSRVELNIRTLKLASNKMEQVHLKGMEKRGALLTYFQETAKAKARAVCEYVIDLLETDKKFLVFAHHQSMLDEVENEIKSHSSSFDYIRIDGSTGSEKRQLMVDKFQNSDSCKCALLSITAANSGITLTQASLVVFAELFWNPGILVQAEDRVYRIGQKNSVIIQYLCAKGTADDYIWPLVNQKLTVLSRAGLTRENLSEASTKDNKSDKNMDIFKEFFIEDDPETPAELPAADSSEKKSTNLLPIAKNQAKIDDLLKGVDLSSFDSPPTKKVRQDASF